VQEKDKADRVGAVRLEAGSRHPPVQVLMIDDHPIIFEGSRKLLERAGVSQVLHASRLSQGFHIYRTAKPDVIFIDLSIGGRPFGGLSFIRRVRLIDPRTPIVVLSMYDDPRIASQALKIGANGYVVKDSPPEELVQACNRVRDGVPYLSHDIASEIAFLEARRRISNPLEGMSDRELQILSQLVEGKSYRSIADNLLVNYKTVTNTYSRLKRKLGARSLPELMQIAIHHLPTTDTASYKPPRASNLEERKLACPANSRHR
jgi:two-component system, NarL family, invasion response regulator UvrY